MVVEGYPWEYESTRGLKFNYDDVGPYSIPLENNDKSPFSGADMVAGELWHNMPLGDAIAITGIPRAAYWHIEDATGETWLTLYYDDGDVLSFCDTDSHEADYRLATATIRSYLPGPRSLQVGDSMDAVLQSFKVTPPDLAEKGDIPGCMTLYAENIIFQDSPFEHLLLAPSGIIESSSYYRWEDSGDAKAYIRYAHPIYPYAINELEIPEREYPYLPMYRLSFTIQEGIVVEYRWSMGAEAA